MEKYNDNKNLKNKESKNKNIKNYTAVDEFGNNLPASVDKDTGLFEVKNPYHVQMYKKHLPTVRMLVKTNPIAGEIFLFFIENMDGTNALVVSYKVLQEITGKSERSVARAVKVLKDKKLVKILKSGNMNVYCVNAEIVWQKAREDIKHAKFRANVYLTKTEQSQDDSNSQNKSNK